MSKFPFHLYVKREKDGDEHYFLLSENLEETVSTGEVVTLGVYELVNTIKVRGTVRIEP